MRKIIIIAVIIVLYVTAAFANMAKTDVLKSAGARAAGMAGAFSAVGNDYSAFFWNPAGLMFVDRTNMSIFYDSVFRAGQVNFGFNYTHLLPDHMITAATYSRTVFNNSKFLNDVFYFTYSTYLREENDFAFGANLKYINISLHDTDVSASTPGFDIGFISVPEALEKKARFSFFIQDVDTYLQWTTNIKEKVPVLFRLGGCWLFDDTALASMDIDVIQFGMGSEVYDKKAVHIGGEKWFKSRIVGNFGFRGGIYWKELEDAQWKFTLGFSYGREDFVFNYVYFPDTTSLGETHKLDFSYYFGEPGKEPERKEAIIAEKPGADMQVLSERFKNLKLDISRKYFSPNDDAVYDTVDFVLVNLPQIGSGEKWKLVIFDIKNNPVKSFNGPGIPPERITWDGSSDTGVLTDGDYTGQLTITYEDKVLWQKKKVVGLDNTPPRFNQDIYPKVFAPVPKSSMRNMTIEINPRYRDTKSWSLFIRTEEGKNLRKFSGEGFTEKLLWNGKDALDNTVEDGDYRVVVELEDFAGNKFRISEAFKIDTYITVYGLRISSPIFKAGTESVIFTPRFDEPAKVKSWDLEIFNNAGNVVRAYRNKGPGTKSAAWNGTDSNNVYVRQGASYGYRITVTQKNGIVTEKSGKIQTDLPVFKETGISLTLAAVDFEKRSSEIPVDEYAYLNQAADAVKKYAQDYYIFIKGYASELGGSLDNMELSIKRVEKVKEYLVNGQGIPAKNIFVIGYGDGEYAGMTQKDEAAKNGQRVEVELMTK